MVFEWESNVDSEVLEAVEDELQNSNAGIVRPFISATCSYVRGPVLISLGISTLDSGVGEF